MNRRESLKTLGITTISTGILLDACKTEGKQAIFYSENRYGDTSMDGLQEFEKERLKKLNSQALSLMSMKGSHLSYWLILLFLGTMYRGVHQMPKLLILLTLL